jgi:hypothetical protein
MEGRPNREACSGGSRRATESSKDCWGRRDILVANLAQVQACRRGARREAHSERKRPADWARRNLRSLGDGAAGFNAAGIAGKRGGRVSSSVAGSCRRSLRHFDNQSCRWRVACKKSCRILGVGMWVNCGAVALWTRPDPDPAAGRCGSRSNVRSSRPRRRPFPRCYLSTGQVQRAEDMYNNSAKVSKNGNSISEQNPD